MNENENENKTNKFNYVQKEIFDWLDTLAKPLVIFVLLFAFVVCTASVYGPSMQNTLYGGEMDGSDGPPNDRLLISNFAYEPQRSDIVVVSRNYTSEPELNYSGDHSVIVKRVIAVEGDTVDITEDGLVTVNGEVIDEPYIDGQVTDPGDQNYPITVEPNKIFVMGDNRGQSLDSRSTQIDQIDVRYVKGHVLFRYLPFSKIGLVS